MLFNRLMNNNTTAIRKAHTLRVGDVVHTGTVMGWEPITKISTAPDGRLRFSFPLAPTRVRVRNSIFLVQDSQN
jgi:2-keto-4-pentenoate hydratase/2-oxohepta-3-ene-1,7-dioic acid hydratase in catechol pathway